MIYVRNDQSFIIIPNYQLPITYPCYDHRKCDNLISPDGGIQTLALVLMIICQVFYHCAIWGGA